MQKFQNSKRRRRNHASICKWGAFTLLALTAVAVCVGVSEHLQHLPSLDAIASICGSGTLLAFPLLGAMASSYIPKDDFEEAVLGAAKSQSKDIEALKNAHNGIERKILEFRKSALASMGGGVTRPGEVSEGCARYLAAIAFAVGLKSGKLESASADLAKGVAKEMLGVEWKAAITTSDFPLPVEYSGEIVELVSRFGRARLYGTVFPLASGQVKLPKLTTDPTFGLIAMSGTVTEKSPQFAFVTFTAEKFGGLIRLPSEIDEDSIVPLGQFLARYATRQIAYVEDWNFFQSTGADSGVNGSVKGLCLSVIDNSKVVQMASTKTHYSDATLANFRALRAVPDEAALYNAAYYLHPTFEQLLSTFNTGGDRPWNPQSQIIGTGTQPLITGPTLDGFPVRWVNTMPAYSTAANVSKVFALFGDANYQYLGIRGGIRFATSTEAGFTTDEILVRALERFTIGLMANGAVAGLETAAS